MHQIFSVHICTLMPQYVLPLHITRGRSCNWHTKMTGTSNTSRARHPSRCPPADAATVRLVKLIEHTTEETNSVYHVGATQRAQRSGLPVIAGEYSQSFF